MKEHSPILTLVVPSRLRRETRAALRFALRNESLSLKTLGQEFEGVDPIRLMVGKFEPKHLNHDELADTNNSCLFWLEREDEIDVSLINTLFEWAKTAVTVAEPIGLMINRDLLVDGEMWREQVVPRLWNPAAQRHFRSAEPWHLVDWSYREDLRIRTLVRSEQIIDRDIRLSIDDQDQLLEAVIFHQQVGDDETVLQLTDNKTIPIDRMGIWCSLQTARADSLRKLQRTEEAAALSLAVVSAYEDYAQAWFVHGCCALELGEFVVGSGAFRRAQKGGRNVHHDLYSEPSVWEWQAILGFLYARVALGDFEGVKSHMMKVHESVPEPYAQRLSMELTSALIDQKEVLIAWDLIQPRLEKDADSAVPMVLNVCEYYTKQEGQSAAFDWMVSLSSNYGNLLRCYPFCDALYQLAKATGDRKALHDILWIMMEFDEAPEYVYDELAKDLFGRGRIDEAERVQSKRKSIFPNDSNTTS